MDIFPAMQPEIYDLEDEMPLYQDVDWDFEANKPIFRNGDPVIVTGHRAVMGWAYRALQTVRGMYEIYTMDYGSEVDSLYGQGWSAELSAVEAERYVVECLKINPYIIDITDVDVIFELDVLHIACTVITLYSEEKINV